MLTFILKRFLALIPVGLGVVCIVSALIHLVPGDPADQILGPYATEEEKVQLRHDLGLDKPFAQKLLSYYGDIALMSSASP